MQNELNELHAATEAHAAAVATANQARRFETDAVNRLNAAQKAVSTKLAEMQRGAPRDTDWAEQRRLSHARTTEVG